MKYCKITLTSVAKKDVCESAMLVGLASGDWGKAQENQNTILLTLKRLGFLKSKIQFMNRFNIEKIKLSNLQ